MIALELFRVFAGLSLLAVGGVNALVPEMYRMLVVQRGWIDGHTFTPLAALAGGAMIGLAAVALLAATGRIAGISGIAVRILPPWLDDQAANRLAFILGLVATPALVLVTTGALPVTTFSAGPGVLVAGGLLVGFGSVWGSGCTSGHGICGLSRLSLRSLAAVATFMATAMATVFVLRHLV